MARGAPSPSPALPKVAFTKVEEESSTKGAGTLDLQARSYGYNDYSSFHRPDPYIRYIEPLETDLAVQVEYDMDEQDQEWLDAVNKERKSDQLNQVSYETFEIIMDRLEKEWFDLTKNIPKPDMALPSEDSTCAICDDAEGENSNAIVFCDGCNLAVHQDCYGVPYIPEGQWLCRKCTVSPEIPVSCILCPNEGGAFKQTVHGEWAHLLCAIWVPETRVANDVFMEPITGVDRINKQRWKLKCSICGIREGACIQCSKSSCFLAFHATCARREKLLMPMKSAHGTEPATLASFCEKHLPKDQLEAHQAALAELDNDNKPSDNAKSGFADANVHAPRSSKTARAYAKTYKLGPPLVPAIIVRRIIDYIGKIVIRRKPEFVYLVCKYWSLKREARRGAPLLKRLHLEPWTASAASKQQTDEEKMMKLELLRELRKDLETVRMLAELARKRETQKSKQAQTIQEVLSLCLFPHEPQLRLAFEKIIGFDRNEFFKSPVSRSEVPDYFDVIKKPMCWETIDSKLDGHAYWDLSEFQDDINLVISNAMLYNKYDTPIYKAAQRIRTAAKPILQGLEQLARPSLYHTQADETGPSEGEGNGPTGDSLNNIGNLEPPMNVLELLQSQDAIKDDIDLILDADPLLTLFRYEFGKLKPPPPPPPPKLKRVREKKAPRRDALDGSPGFRAPDLTGPRTRRERAAAAAFEAEVGGVGEDDALLGEGQFELPETAESSALGSRGGKRWKRAPMVLPGHADIPPVVDDVDNQRSFAMFDEGWILPPSQRRGGRAPIEKHDIPPPKKRMRTEQGRSRLSVFSTPVSENQTLRETPLEADTSYEEHNGTDERLTSPPQSEPMDVVDAPNLDIKSEHQSPAVTQAVPPRSVVIIEELDTPQTRRLKAAARKEQKKLEEAEAERQREKALLMVAVTSVGEGGDVSELSELSELDGNTDEERSGGQNIKGKDKVSIPPQAQGATGITQRLQPASIHAATSTPDVIVLRDGQRLESGTLVWAKAETYPWWAAVVFDEDIVEVPPEVLIAPRVGKPPHHLVKFFDKGGSWQWATLDRLKLLGESKALDAAMLAGSAKGQRFKNPKVRSECRKAYYNAVSEMETDGDRGADSSAVVEDSTEVPVPDLDYMAAQGEDSTVQVPDEEVMGVKEVVVSGSGEVEQGMELKTEAGEISV